MGGMLKRCMANRRSPNTQLSDEIIHPILEQQKSCCAICNVHSESKTMSPEHIIPLRMGGEDIPENVHYICSRCQKSRKVTIRIPEGLAEEVSGQSDLSFAEAVRNALIESLNKEGNLIVANPPYARDPNRLKQQNQILHERIKLIQQALEWNPYEKYVVKSPDFSDYSNV